MQDILDIDYTIYDISVTEGIIESPELLQRFIVIDNRDERVERVNHVQSSACIDFGAGDPLDRAREFGLRVSGKFISTSYEILEIG